MGFPVPDAYANVLDTKRTGYRPVTLLISSLKENDYLLSTGRV